MFITIFNTRSSCDTCYVREHKLQSTLIWLPRSFRIEVNIVDKGSKGLYLILYYHYVKTDYWMFATSELVCSRDDIDCSAYMLYVIISNVCYKRDLSKFIYPTAVHSTILEYVRIQMYIYSYDDTIISETFSFWIGVRFVNLLILRLFVL